MGSQIENVVSVAITRRTTAVERAGFGTLLHLAMHRAWADRIRTYTDAADMLDDNFAVTDPAYRGAVAYFSQTPKPQRIKIGRVLTTNAVSAFIDEVVEATKYTVWLDGIGFDYTSGTGLVDDPTTIEQGLVDAINDGYAITSETVGAAGLGKFTIAGSHVSSFPVGAQFQVDGSTSGDGDYTVASVALVSGSTVITTEEAVVSSATNGSIKNLTGTVAGGSDYSDGTFVVNLGDDASTIRVSSTMHLEFTLSGTMAENLTAIEAIEALTWYAVTLSRQYGASNVDRQQDLATEMESRDKMFGIASDDADIIDVALASDDADTGTIARQVQAAGLTKTWTMYSAQATGDADAIDDTFPDAAFFGARLTTDPGKETWKFASLATITADELTATQRLNALAKNANIYVPATTSISMTEEGKVGVGEFIDVMRFIDYLVSEIAADVFGALINLPAPMVKVPYTDAGIAVVENKLKGALTRNTTTGNNVRGLASYTTSVPLAADVSLADKAARHLRDVNFDGKLSGAVHFTDINGTVSA